MPTPIKNADYSIPASHLLYGMRRQKLPIDTVLHAASIDEAVLRNPSQRIHYRQFLGLLKAVNRATEDEFFGLTPNRCKPSTYATMASTALHSSTLKAFIEHCCHFYYLVTDDVLFSFEERDAKAHVRVRLKYPDYDPHCFLAEYWLLHLYLTFSWVAGLRIPLLSVQSSLAAPPSADRLLYYILPHWESGQRCNQFSFHSKYLKLPIIKTQAELDAHLQSGVGQIPVWPSDKITVNAQAKGRLKQGLLAHNSFQSIEQLALALHTTERSLRRSLKAEGTSYQQLLDDTRRDFAIELLCSQHRSINDVAEILGFSEPRSFSRAFKQWTGSPPSHFQQQN